MGFKPTVANITKI